MQRFKPGDRVRFKLRPGERNAHGWFLPKHLRDEPNIATVYDIPEGRAGKGFYGGNRVDWLYVRFDTNTPMFDYYQRTFEPVAFFEDDFEHYQSTFKLVIDIPDIDDAILNAQRIATLLNMNVRIEGI